MTRRLNPWLKLSMDAAMMGLEAQTVIGLRMLKMASGGPGVAAEGQLMVTEKIGAAIAAQAMLVNGAMRGTSDGGASRAVAHYRRKVRANRRRLTKAALR